MEEPYFFAVEIPLVNAGIIGNTKCGIFVCYSLCFIRRQRPTAKRCVFRWRRAADAAVGGRTVSRLADGTLFCRVEEIVLEENDCV